MTPGAATFVDTSAVYAVLDRDDAFHAHAADALRRLHDEGTALVTHNYVLLESVNLIHRRLGPRAARAFHQDIAPLMDVVWVDDRLHLVAMIALLATGRRDLSLVDCVSFETMRARGLQQAFAFDRRFVEQGFAIMPGPT